MWGLFIFGGVTDDGVSSDCNAIGVVHTGPKSGCKLPTLFDGDCDDGVSECW